MPKVFVNGIRFHYWQVGEGPDIIMSHGLTGNLAVWHLKMVPMLRRHYRVTTWDLRGHGRSDMPRTGYTTQDLAADLRGLMDALGIERAHLVGHSLGADLSLHFALHYPERAQKLVLIEASIPALVHLRKDENWTGWDFWAQMIKEFTGVEVPPDRRTDVKYLVRLSMEAPIIYGPARGLPRKKEPILRLVEETTLIDDYEKVEDLTLENIARIPHPKLLIYDSGSPYLTTYNVLREVLTNYKAVLFPPSEHRHFSPLEQPELVVHHIRQFLEAEEFQPTPALEEERP